MELHESLYALGLSQGRELFNDADSFRGALDDYLDEDSASTGDINLLVDAVRLGAFQSMTTMLDSGAASDRAVAEAGARLARDRGSADVGGAQWALAVLGYAIGKVSDDQVRRYRTQHASSPIPQPGGAPTALPPQGSVPPVTQRPAMSPPQPTATPAWPSSGGHAAAPAPPPAAAGSGGVPSYGSSGAGFASSVPSGPPPRKRGPLLGILIGLLALIVVVGVVIVVVVVNGGGDEPKKDEPTAADNSESGGAVDLSPEAITERYSSLGTQLAVGAGITSCTAADSLAAGEQEKLECSVKDGSLELTTYAAPSDIDAVRTRVVDLDEGQLSNPVDSGYFYLYDPSNADDPRSDVPKLYWDSKAGLQTAQFTANDGVDAQQLINTWKATSPTVDEPTDVYSPDLEAFVQRFKILRCDRIPTLYPGELEESQCNHHGNSVWVATFKNLKDFRDYRNLAKRLAKQDGNLVDQYWWKTEDPTQAEQGKIYGYIDDSGNGVLYADEEDCLCYFQAYDSGEGDPEALRRTFFTG